MTDTTNRPMKVFLCHAKEDKATVRVLYRFLRKNGIDAWFDEEKLLPGQDWRVEIPKAIKNSDAILVCLSRNATTKEGYIQKEIKNALDVADEKPEGTIFVIPARLDECNLPDRLSQWQWVDMFRDRGGEWLLRGLDVRAHELGIEISRNPIKDEPPLSGHNGGTVFTTYESPIPLILTLPVLTNLRSKVPVYEFGGIQFVKVPAGEFLMGDGKGHKVLIPYDYLIGRYEVTEEMYSQYVDHLDNDLSTWLKGLETEEKEPNRPVVSINWKTAQKYCQWLNTVYENDLPTNFIVRLPTEVEWEKAARGLDGRLYPWGNEFEIYRCNTLEASINTTSSVDAYSPQGDSPFGVADMCGNVWEWTNSLYKSFPYNPGDGRENTKTPGLRVLRGGSYRNQAVDSRVYSRYGVDVSDVKDYNGIRLVIAPSLF